VNTIESITVDSQGWVQAGSILGQYAPGTTHGYAHVTRTARKNPLIAYAVVKTERNPATARETGLSSRCSSICHTTLFRTARDNGIIQFDLRF
jgi:hypothetical protein